MSGVAFAGVVICRLDGPVAARVHVYAFHCNRARIAVYSILRMGCPAEPIPGYGLPPDRVLRDDCGMPANRGLRIIQCYRAPLSRSGYALKRQGLRGLYATSR